MGDMNISVLAIDDEPGLAESIQMVLTLAGYSAFYEMDGLSAVNFCKANRPDIVIIDVSLGDKSISGLEVLKRVKELKPDVMCIMITRFTDQYSVEKAKELGAFRYVLKPLTGDDIIYLVNESEQVIKQKRAEHGQQ